MRYAPNARFPRSRIRCSGAFIAIASYQLSSPKLVFIRTLQVVKMTLVLSPSNFDACIHHAQKVWKRCLDAPEEFRTLSAEVGSLQHVLGEVQESVCGHELNQRSKSDLRQLIAGCDEVFMELQSILDKHKRWSSQSKRSWNRLSWGKDPVERLRQRISATNGLLAAFNVSFIRYVISGFAIWQGNGPSTYFTTALAKLVYRSCYSSCCSSTKLDFVKAQ